MKKMKIIPVVMSAIMIQIIFALPLWAAGDDMKMKPEDNMMMNEKAKDEMMASDTMHNTKMINDSRSSMMVGAKGHHATGKVEFVQKMRTVTFVVA